MSNVSGIGVADATEYAATLTLTDGSLVIAGGSTVGMGGSGKLKKAYRLTH